MRTLRGVLTGAIAVVLSSAGLTAPAVAADLTPPSAPYTAFTVHVEGWGSNDGSFSYEASRTTLLVYQQTAYGYALEMDGYYGNNEHWHNLNVSPPTGTRFAAGQSYPTTVATSPSPTTTVLNVTGDGQGCEDLSQGTLNVLEATYDDATGKFTAFAANYSVSCAGKKIATGEIRFQSSIGYRATDVWGHQPQMGQQPAGMLGTPQDVTVSVDGTEPTTFGDASLSGTNPDEFQITGNTCSGQTLSYGQTCTVTITPKASSVGTLEMAFLTLLENSFAGKVVRQLSLIGYDPRDAGADPLSFDFGTVAAYDVSAPKTVILTGTTDLPITFGQATITGANAAYFKITEDGCSNTTLDKGQTCSITAVTRPAPNASGGAAVSLPDNSFAGSTQIPLGVNGYNSDRGTYYPMSPYRILDTRSGLGGPTGMVGSGGVVHLQLTGAGGVPADASTVVLNVTVTGATNSGYITVYPTGVPNRPTASSVNFVKGWTGANSVTVKVGTNGQVDFYVAGGPTHVIADVFGYYTRGHVCCYGYMGGQYHPLTQPVRLTDSREWGTGKVGAGHFINSIADWNDTINPHVWAFAVNITATEPDGPGYLTAWNGDVSSRLPDTSTLNYTKGATVPNFAVVPTRPCQDCADNTGLPSIGVYTANNAHIIVDLVGYYDDGTLPNGLRFNPAVPTRIMDTRSGLGWPSSLGPATTATVTTPGSMADVDTVALATNVTAVLPTAPTYLTVWPAGIDGVDRPGTSNLNPTAGSVVPNAVQTMIGPDGQFNVYNAGGYCDVVVDVVGTFEMYPPTPPSDWSGSAMNTFATNPQSLVTPTAHSAARAKKL